MDALSAHGLRRLGAALAGVVLLSTACGGNGNAGRLPDATVESLDGGATISLADVDGPAVINLWATWCVPCRTEIPEIEAVHRLRGGEVAFLGIDVGETADEARQFVADVGATYDQYLDADGSASTALEATTLPVTIVIDADGTVVARELRRIDQDSLGALIDDALGD